MIRIPSLTSEQLIVSQSADITYPPVDKAIILEATEGESAGPLSYEKSLRLLDAIGISRVKEIIATNTMEAKMAAIDICYPIDMKSICVHEEGPAEVVKNITDENTMRLEFRRLMLSSDVKGVLISPSLDSSLAYFGIRHKAKLGHLIVCGDCPDESRRPQEFCACTMPVGKAEAEAAYERIKGTSQLNKVVFTDTLRRLSALCSSAPRIDKMDIIPAVVSTRSVVALDIAVSLK